MNEMVERVVKAAREWHVDVLAPSDSYLAGLSRAIISAMREPTKAMCDATQKSDDDWWEDLTPNMVWERMIDEALR